jgi:hypothetical protein
VTTLLLSLLLSADPCVPASGNAIEQNLALGAVFTGGLVVRATGHVAAVETALTEAGVTGATVKECPQGRVVVWVPGATLALLPALTRQAKLSQVESSAISPSEGQAWLQKECRDVARCQAITERASPNGMCGVALSSLGEIATERALAACSKAEPASVACALAGDKKCQRAFRTALRH